MIRIENLNAGYGGRQILRDVTAEFPSGQVTVLAGPNGSGKSTLLKVIAGILKPISGKIECGGEGSPARKVAYMPQTRPVPAVTAGRMVLHGRFPYLTYPKHYTAEDRRLAEEAMKRCGCYGLRHRQMTELSGGERQSVYFAMAYVQDTPAVLMDEPTTFLDISHQLELMRQAREMADEGKTVVLVLHDLAMAMRCADRLVILADGCVKAQGNPETLRTSGLPEEIFGVRIGRIDTESGPQFYYET